MNNAYLVAMVYSFHYALELLSHLLFVILLFLLNMLCQAPTSCVLHQNVKSVVVLIS